MTFHQDIAAIQATMAGSGTTGEAVKPFAQPVSGLGEGHKMFDTLAAQFEIHIGPSVICLPMGDTDRDAARESAD